MQQKFILRAIILRRLQKLTFYTVPLKNINPKISPILHIKIIKEIRLNSQNSITLLYTCNEKKYLKKKTTKW